jgi:hypothetical protein
METKFLCFYSVRTKLELYISWRKSLVILQKKLIDDLNVGLAVIKGKKAYYIIWIMHNKKQMSSLPFLFCLYTHALYLT